MFVVVWIIDDKPHPRSRAVAGDTLSQRESDPQVPVEEEEFLQHLRVSPR